ncbi:MAG: ABC transporter ATP-binding protein [Aquamicrobium sp.]|uniref:ABC transporter ATP-binding protein n=1 Tax=Aquamicrobium sp. TaxID=1872579 RepID=UPI00349EBD35|nr:ABC transporter ATP-binding protein [Aquamicrobium sp.]
MVDTLLSVRNVHKKFGQHAALADIALDVRHGEFIAMLGPSGCGKTTLLRSIAGFLTPDSGSIVIAGEDVTRRPPNRRPLNTVFQNYALFPHMRIIDNVAYGPRRKGESRARARELAQEALDLVGLATFGERYPQELSGGQQQRVALARALVNKPKLLLLDEPLSALDLKLRKQMQIELKHLQEKLGIAFVFVTHDQEEALTMADRIVVMNAGRIEQIGTGDEIYRRPASRFVADFIGEANFLACEWTADGRLKPAVGSQTLEAQACDRARRQVAMLRPEQIRLLDAPLPGLSTARCRVEDVIDIGAHTTVIVSGNDARLTIRLPGGAPKPVRGGDVLIGFDPADIRVLEE